MPEDERAPTVTVDQMMYQITAAAKITREKAAAIAERACTDIRFSKEPYSDRELSLCHFIARRIREEC